MIDRRQANRKGRRLPRRQCGARLVDRRRIVAHSQDRRHRVRVRCRRSRDLERIVLRRDRATSDGECRHSAVGIHAEPLRGALRRRRQPAAGQLNLLIESIRRRECHCGVGTPRWTQHDHRWLQGERKIADCEFHRHQNRKMTVRSRDSDRIRTLGCGARSGQCDARLPCSDRAH